MLTSARSVNQMSAGVCSRVPTSPSSTWMESERYTDFFLQHTVWICKSTDASLRRVQLLQLQIFICSTYTAHLNKIFHLCCFFRELLICNYIHASQVVLWSRSGFVRFRLKSVKRAAGVWPLLVEMFIQSSTHTHFVPLCLDQ